MTELKIPDNYDPRVKICSQKKRGFDYLDYLLPPQNGKPGKRRRVKAYKKRRQTEMLRTKKEAQLLAHEFSDDDLVCMGIDPHAKSDREMTLTEFVPMFRRLRNRGRKHPLSPRYVVDQDRQIEKYLLPTFGDMLLRDIGDTVIDDFIEDLQLEEHPAARPKDLNGGGLGPVPRLANSTINNIVGHLGRMLTIAQRRKLIDSRPFIEKLPDEHDDDFDFLEKDELLRLFEACQPPYGNMIKLLALTGMRAMEASGLRWYDYDPVKKQIHVERQLDYRTGGKNKRGRIIPRFRPPKCTSKRWIDVGPALAQVLRDQAEKTRLADGLIFETEAGNPVVYEIIRRRLQQACRRARLREVAPHVLRRTYISHRVMAGDNPVLVQRVAGHKSIQVTLKYYTRLGVEYTQEAASRFDEYLFGGEGKSEAGSEEAKPDLKVVK